MGKASSSKKVARAAKAAGRPGAKKNYAWPMAIGGVVIVGVILVVLSFSGNSANEAPRTTDHWHAAYGVYHCDTYLPSFPQEAADEFGIHTHGEGLMHIHPFSSAVTGKNANIKAFANDVGMTVTDTSIDAPSIGLTVKNGDKCKGKSGRVKLFVWDELGAARPRVITKDIVKYAPPDQSVWTLAFVPDGVTPPLPASAANLQDPLAVEEGRQPATQTSTTLPPAATSTTVPGEPTSTTSTTAAP